MTGRLHSVWISTISLSLAMTVGLAVLVAISTPQAVFATQKQTNLAEPGGGGSADTSHGDDDQPTITGRKDTQVENTRTATVDGEPQKADPGIQPRRDSGLRVVLERVELFVQFYLGVQR